MADEKNFLQKVSWDGDPQGWPDFVRRVRLIFERTKRSRRHLLAPEIVTNLTGRAWNITQDLDHAALVRRNGTIYLLEFLRDRLGKNPVPDVGLRLRELDTAAPDASAPESLEEDKTFPEDLDEDLDPGVRGDRGCSNSDDSTKALEELRLWESYEEAAMEAGARGPCGLKKMDTGADAILENQEVLYLGTQLPHAAQAAAESSNSWGEPENGFWSTEDDGSCIWSQDFGDGDYFHEDASGVFWSWNHSHKDDLGDLPPEQQREIEDAFSAAEAKVGSFTQARQAVKAKPAPPVLYQGEAFAVGPGDP
ncbi:unnamed protein product, partial [Symbiodinium microadriaticum]